jgi:hypothetical protein
MPTVRGQVRDYDEWHTSRQEEVETDEEAEAVADEMERSGLYDRVVIESKQYIEPSAFDRKGTEMKYHNTLDKKRRGVGAKTKTRPETVVIRDTKTGKVYGRRTLVQKSTESNDMKLLASLLDIITEASTDITLLPDQLVGEIRKLIRKGAQDQAQDWANALELVHKAYQVANVRRPAPDQKGAWKQYEELIQFAVKELTKARGLDGKWRMTSSVIREQYEKNAKDPLDMPIGKRRFFVDVPGSGSAEIAAKNMDEIIEQMTNKLRRHGAKTRVDERSEKYVVLSVWVNNIKRDRIVVKEVS